ncbi:MAG: serine/threonine protein kinase [Anaerolineae bacterium]|nr:serine/threonine protein kinase [Anaerolineae bacterium]
MATDDLIGKTIGQFKIIEEVGRGGMASVYRARQSNINRVVAIKVLPRTLLHDPSFYERFVREVDLVAHLEHPHILPIYDYGEVDGVPYIAMRYLAGGSMAQWLRRGLPLLDKLTKPMTQIASALDYAHQQGVIHRDLKPGNILLDENDNAYLSDFGIARVLDSNLTGSAIIGTPAYMSPEQANGRPLDARSDIYSLGVVLYELVTGQEPYEAETPVALLLKHINEPMPSARALRPELPIAGEMVILRATAKQPDERYPSALDLADAFTAAIHPQKGTGVDLDDDANQPTVFDADSLLKRTPPPITRQPAASPGTRPGHHTPGSAIDLDNLITPPPMQPPSQVSVTQQTARRTSPILYAVIGIVLIAVIGAGAFFMTQNNPPPATPAPMPTPFGGAYTVRRSEYTISVPDNWSFSDQSNDLGTVHIWQSGTDAYVALWLVERSKLTPSSAFLAAVDAFDEREMNDQPSLTYLNGDTAEDGSVRHSWRLDGENAQNFPPGQTDNFYLLRGKYLAVVQVYSSYGTGNELVPTFQQVLDSLRVTQA